MQPVTPDELTALQSFLQDACGLTLYDDQRYLVQSRLSGVIEAEGLETLGDLVARLQCVEETELRGRVVEAMTTHETRWFRDAYPFDILWRVVLPELARSRRAPIRIWCAACATGEEAYSVSMLVDEYRRAYPGAWRKRVELVATDVSSRVLAHARRGVYRPASVESSLSDDRRHQYFERVPQGYRVVEAIRRPVTFEQLNLLDSFESLGRFDIVFCRNVLIYFNQARRDDIIERLIEVLRPGGYLFLGTSEWPSAQTANLTMCSTEGGVVYRRRNAG